MKTYHNIHPDFKLNGNGLSYLDLKEIAYSYIKEGQPYERAIGNFLVDWLNEKEVVEVKTSGSTGTPKTIQLKKAQMLNSALATGDFFNLKPKYSALHCLPTNFIAGKMMLVRAMALGLRIDCIKPSSTPDINENKKYHFAAMIPLQLQNSIDKISTIDTLIIGGARISENLKEKVQHKKTHIFETYGMTETITHIAAKRINGIDIDSGGTEVFFTVLPNISISKDERNCLIINAPKISDEPVVTNDLVEIISKNKFNWLGRYDNVINSGGVKLIPEQIESVLTAIIANRFFITSLPDETLGRKLVLLIEGSLDKRLLKEQLNNTTELSKYQVPKEIILVPDFIETENGKVSRSKTLELILK